MENPTEVWREVVELEWQEVIAPRRDRLASNENFQNDRDWFAKDENRFGIALSGGGIRSATISLGFLEVLKRFDLLQKADYLSTVSGGGYLGGYVHAKLWEQRREPDPFRKLFGEDKLHLETHRKYLTPGEGSRERLMQVRLLSVFLVSTLMNAVWIALLAVAIWYFIRAVRAPLDGALDFLGPLAIVGMFAALVWHYFLHPLRHRHRLWSSEILSWVEAVLLCIAAVFLLPVALPTDATFASEFSKVVMALAALGLIGFFADPNVLTMHRYYRDRIASAFLGTASPDAVHLTLHELVTPHDAPYPLINTCLNLRDEEGAETRGTFSSDYFLLSPLFCGSSLTGYAETRRRPYQWLPLKTAIAASGAALSPAMGSHTNSVRAFLMTILNVRLGHWICNPKRIDEYSGYHWWPWYHLQELRARAGARSRRVSISDGGHIENLGVFELMRRRCRLIIALDAGADPEFRFGDLENLVRRAREQLGVHIDFGGLDPVELIRPSPSRAYSRSHFAVARLEPIEGCRLGEDYRGLLVYVKSSIRPQRKLNYQVASWTHDYKRHHPSFPHESTANQFFDPLQWGAYYRLGRFMAGDMISEDVREDGAKGRSSVGELLRRWSDLGSAEELEAWNDRL